MSAIKPLKEEAEGLVRDIEQGELLSTAFAEVASKGGAEVSALFDKDIDMQCELLAAGDCNMNETHRPGSVGACSVSDLLAMIVCKITNKVGFIARTETYWTRPTRF